MRTILLALPLLFIGPPSWAAHCPHGQIYRVHMRTCVSMRSPLAHIALKRYHRVSFTDLEEQPRAQHTRRHNIPCDPRTMCGDPVEDRVVDQPAEPEPELNIPYAYGFGDSVMNRPVWRMLWH